MKITKRLLPTLIGLVLFVVGGIILITEAQPGNVNLGSGNSTQNTPAQSVVTISTFDTQANVICSQLVSQLNSWWVNFNNEVANSGKVMAENSNSTPLSPPYSPTTTSVSSSGSSGAFSSGSPSQAPSNSAASQSALSGALDQGASTTSTSTIPENSPAKSYDAAPVEPNPLAVTNTLLNSYMDELDAVVGMQNDTLDELENLQEPQGYVNTLQSLWVQMTEATVAQNQADAVLENIVNQYYTAGLYSVGGSPPVPFNPTVATTLASDSLEYGIVPGVSGSPSPGSLAYNLESIVGAVDTSLAANGLSSCEMAGSAAQNLQGAASSIPNLGADFLSTYISQTGASQPISLAQIFTYLVAPQATNIAVPNNPNSSTATSTTAG